MSRKEIIANNFNVLANAIDSLDLSVFDSKDASTIANWLKSAKELCKAHYDFENGFCPEAK